MATPLRMTMDAGDAAAETIDAGDAAAQSRCAAAPIDAGDAAAPLPSATEIVEVTSGAMPATRDVDLMTVWHFRYWNIKPYRAEGVLHLRDDGQVRLTKLPRQFHRHGLGILGAAIANVRPIGRYELHFSQAFARLHNVHHLPHQQPVDRVAVA